MDFVGSDSLRVLVADRQQAIRDFLVGALREIGVRTVEAADAREAVEIICSVEVHGLVLDSELPELGGLETIRVIRAFQRVPPYLLLAEVLTHDLRAAALDGRATSVLPKPVDAGIFCDIVRTMLLREYGRIW